MDVEAIAKKLSWTESFTLRRIVGRRGFLLPVMRFEMTRSEREAIDRLISMGAARRAIIGYALTPTGLAVRDYLIKEGK